MTAINAISTLLNTTHRKSLTNGMYVAIKHMCFFI